MDEKIGSFIVLLVQTVVFMIPVLILIYKQGRKDQILDEAVRDIGGLGAKVSKIEKIQENGISEVKEKVGNIELSLVRLSTSMEYISKQIEELKTQ